MTSEEEVEDGAQRLSQVDGETSRHTEFRNGGSSSSPDSSQGQEIANANDHSTEDHNNDDDERDIDNAFSSNSGRDDDYDDENENEDEEDDDEFPPRSFSQHAFAPPFYGRPPTPLPPSPSLTSLLRPSRPTTPDVSDDDGHSTAHGHSYRHHGHHGNGEPLPRARPKVPTYEYYGFVLYLFSSLSFGIYLLWSYLPSPFLHALGIYYYPNRWWSLAIPSFLVMLLVYIYVALAGYNLEILTLPLNSIETVVDEAAKVAVVDEKGRIIRDWDHEKERERERDRRWRGEGGKEKDRDGKRRSSGKVSGNSREERRRSGGSTPSLINWREVWNEGTDAVMDVPLAGVCEVLYGQGSAWESEDDDDEDVVVTT